MSHESFRSPAVRPQSLPQTRRQLVRGVVLTAALGTLSCATTSLGPAHFERAEKRAELQPGEVSVRWLGTAGFEIRTHLGVLLLDPFVTRPGLVRVALGRLTPDTETLERVLPEADAVLIGHSHYDHLLDAPSIAVRTEALLAGTETTCRIAKNMEPDVRCRAVRGGERFVVGPFDITAIPSQHGKAPIIGVPIPGTVVQPPRWESPHLIDMPMGGAMLWVVRTEGLTLVHLSSANLPADRAWLTHAAPEGVDVLLPSIAIRDNTPDFAADIVRLLRPRLVIPHHYDNLLGDLEEPLGKERLDDVRAFGEELGAVELLPLEPYAEHVLDADDVRALPRAKAPEKKATTPAAAAAASEGS